MPVPAIRILVDSNDEVSEGLICSFGFIRSWIELQAVSDDEESEGLGSDFRFSGGR